MTTFQNNPNATAQQNIEQQLIAFSYNPDPADPNYVRLPPNFVEKQTFGSDATGVRIDIVQDQITGKAYVVSRGTDNTQNVFSDLTIANNKQLDAFLPQVTEAVTGLISSGSGVEFVGHSYGGEISDQLALAVIRQAQNPDPQSSNAAITTNQVLNQVSITGYNPAPLFGFDPQNNPADSILSQISTNYRMVVPGPNTFSNGLTVGGDAITVGGGIPGTVYEVALPSGLPDDLATLHSSVPFGSADFTSARLVTTNGVPGLGIDNLATIVGNLGSLIQPNTDGSLTSSDATVGVATGLGLALINAAASSDPMVRATGSDLICGAISECQSANRSRSTQYDRPRTGPAAGGGDPGLYDRY